MNIYIYIHTYIHLSISLSLSVISLLLSLSLSLFFSSLPLALLPLLPLSPHLASVLLSVMPTSFERSLVGAIIAGSGSWVCKSFFIRLGPCFRNRLAHHHSICFQAFARFAPFCMVGVEWPAACLQARACLFCFACSPSFRLSSSSQKMIAIAK